MTDTEIYVDGVATAHFQNFNSLLEVLRGQVLSQYQPVEEDAALKALEAMQVQEEDYFCQVTHRTWDTILHAIKEMLLLGFCPYNGILGGSDSIFRRTNWKLR